MNIKRGIKHSFALFFMLTLVFAGFPGVIGAEKSTDYTDIVEETIQETATHILQQGVTSEWEAIGVYKAGFEVPESYRDIFYKKVEEQVIQAGRVKITDIERLAMAAHTIDIDPRAVDGINFIEKIYNSEDNSNGSDSMIFQGNNGPIFALLALDSRAYDVPADARWTREDLIQYLIDGQNVDGSWSLFGTTPSYDITAMALIALGKYKDREDVQQVIEAAVSFLSEAQSEEGGFNDPWNGGVSLESAAQVLIGLTSVGVDPISEAFTKENANLVDHILSFIAEDGGFKHLPDDSRSNGMATEQGLQALVAYQLFIQGKPGLYDFGTADEIIEEPEKEVDIIIGEEAPVAAGETVKVANGNAEVVLPDDLPEGTKLSITVPNEETAPYREADLELAGDWFDFEFIGLENFTGEFSLTLGVSENADLDKVGMYHFNEEEVMWELVEAVVDHENRTITANVHHFSVYGVFEHREEPEEEEIPVDEVPIEETPVEEESPINDESDTDIDDSSNDLDTDSSGDDGEKSTHEEVLPKENGGSEQVETKNLLPNTATNTYNFMLVGLLLLAIGSSLLIIRTFRVRSN